MKKYRVTRYNPKFRDTNGFYIKETWISCFDIGRAYEDTILTLDEYLKVEKNYGEVILDVLLKQNVKELEVKQLESRISVKENIQNMTEIGIKLTNKDIQFLSTVANGTKIAVQDIKEVAALILRECLWCKLVSKNPRAEVLFGYDLYSYVLGEAIEQKDIENYERFGIFVEKYVD